MAHTVPRLQGAPWWPVWALLSTTHALEQGAPRALCDPHHLVCHRSRAPIQGEGFELAPQISQRSRVQCTPFSLPGEMLSQHGGMYSSPCQEKTVYTQIRTECSQQCAIFETMADCPTLDHLSFPHLMRVSISKSHCEDCFDLGGQSPCLR